jgi:hypothetical protein
VQLPATAIPTQSSSFIADLVTSIATFQKRKKNTKVGNLNRLLSNSVLSSRMKGTPDTRLRAFSYIFSPPLIPSALVPEQSRANLPM